MDKIDAIRELREQVEAGTLKLHQVFNAFDSPYLDTALQQRAEDARKAYNGSLDAAKTLHDALLPGKSWTVCPGGAGVDYSRHDFRAEADNENPARAWLVAILRALEAQEGGE